MIEDTSFSSGKLYDSNYEQSTESKNKIFNTNIETINNDYNNIIFNTNTESINNYYNYNHYFCIRCNKFPYIKFCKDRKNIRFACSCFNNKKISIEEFFKLFSIKDSLSIFLSKANLNINIEDKLICKSWRNRRKFKGFSKFYLNNYCEDCYEYKNEIHNNDIIKFDEIRIKEDKIKEIIEKINDNKDISEEISEEGSNKFRLIKINENTYEKLSEEEHERFINLINIIINDYKNYPNFTHFFNIKNLLYLIIVLFLYLLF